MEKWISMLLLFLVFSTALAESEWEKRLALRAEYAESLGFDTEDESRPQLMINMHSYDSWKAGATIEPVPFYLDIDLPVRLLGEKSAEAIKLFQKHSAADVGVWLRMDGESYEPLFFDNGVKAVQCYDRIYEAGPDFDRLLDMAAEALGYRPGDMDFIGKKITQAEFEWLAGESRFEDEIYRYGGGRVLITDEKRLAELARRLENANYTLGSVNCPSPAFMTLKLDDGTSASIAVAVNSFSTFFYRGVCFDFQESDITDIFNLKETVFYKSIIGG